MRRPKYVIIASQKLIMAKSGRFGDAKSRPKLFNRKRDAQKAIAEFLAKNPTCRIWNIKAERWLRY